MVRNLDPPGTVLKGVTSRLLACASLTAVALGAPACVMNVDHEGTIEHAVHALAADLREVEAAMARGALEVVVAVLLVRRVAGAHRIVGA